jgi:hypothetical protein
MDVEEDVASKRESVFEEGNTGGADETIGMQYDTLPGEDVGGSGPAKCTPGCFLVRCRLECCLCYTLADENATDYTC